MKNFPKRILLALLLSVSILGLAACSATETTDPAVQEESVSATEPKPSTEAKEDDSLAARCSKVWEQKWAEIELDGVVSNLEGRIFSVDFDNDQTDELVFLYDDDVSYQGVVYRLGDSIEELGGFTVSNTGSEFSFALYENPQGNVLYHKAERTHEADGSGTEIEESFIRLADGALIQESLYSTDYNGDVTYYDSMAAGANELNEEDYELLRIGMLGGSTPAKTISFQPGDFFDCSDPNEVTQRVEQLLSQNS